MRIEGGDHGLIPGESSPSIQQFELTLGNAGHVSPARLTLLQDNPKRARQSTSCP